MMYFYYFALQDYLAFTGGGGGEGGGGGWG
jgi:hypothetical protein